MPDDRRTSSSFFNVPAASEPAVGQYNTPPIITRSSTGADATLLPLETPDASTPLSAVSAHPMLSAASGPSRRWSTLDDYYHVVAHAQNWVEQERKFLRLEALHQQQGVSGFAGGLPSSLTASSWFDEFRSKTIAVKSRLWPSYKRGATWGQYQFTLWLTAQPAVVSELFYSRLAIRFVSTIIAIAFALLGTWLYVGSKRTVSFSVPYTGLDEKIVFQLHTKLAAPIYVYTSITGFWQNARDFVNSQPPYLGRGYRCHGMTTAGQFCAVRPLFQPPLFPSNQTFCDLPADTPLEPCGMNALWTNFDAYTLTKTLTSVTDPTNDGVEVPKRIFTVLKRTVRAHTEDIIRTSPRLAIEEERLGPDEEKSTTTSIVLGLQTLKDLLGWNDALAQRVKKELRRQRTPPPKDTLASSEKNPVPSQWYNPQDQARSAHPETGSTTVEQQQVATQNYVDMGLEELHQHLKTADALNNLAQRIQKNQLSPSQEQLLSHVINIINQSDEDNKSATQEEGWRPIVRTLGDILRQSNSQTSLADASEQGQPNHPVQMGEPTARIISPHRPWVNDNANAFENDAVLSQVDQTERNIVVHSSPEILLSQYQRQVTYPLETSTITQAYERTKATPWMPPNSLQWFLWRRPAATSSFLTLTGRIDEDLDPGVYTITCVFNSFPELQSLHKKVKFVSSLSTFGGPQFIGAALAFLVAVLYTMVWII